MVDRVNIKKLVEEALQTALLQTSDLVQQMVDEYLLALEQHIGKIPGSGTSDLGWEPLDIAESAGGTTFWYRTGAVANHIVSKVTIEKNRIHAVVGLPKGAPGYQEALWNEFGWTPHHSSKVVRRAVFIPLAEQHVRELNERLKARFSTMKLHIKVNI